MKLREFLMKCTTNTAEIDVYNKKNEIKYSGMMYLLFHNVEDKYDTQLRQELLDSNVASWQLENYDGLSIFCDC